MADIKQSTEVNVPVETAYSQWTQFETLPQFMEDVDRVEQRSERELHWKAKIGGIEKEWDARITSQEPNRKVAWQSVDGPLNNDTVTFEALEPNRCRVNLQIEYEPDDWKEKVADIFGVLDSRAKNDLENFKEFIEQRGHATGTRPGEPLQH